MVWALTIPQCTACNPPLGFTAYSEAHYAAGLCLPFPPFIKRVVNRIRVPPFQLTPNSYAGLISLYLVCKANNFPAPSHRMIQYYFQIKKNKEYGTYYLSCRGKTKAQDLVGPKLNRPGDFNVQYFFVDDVRDIDYTAFNFDDGEFLGSHF